MLASLGLLRLLVTHPQDALQPADPEGGVHGCTPFSDRAMDGESENPWTSIRRVSGVGEAAFFGYFLCGGKESKSPTAKAFDF